MSTKDTLIKFLKGKATTFTLDEVNGMIALISGLEEPKPKTKNDDKQPPAK